MDSLLNDLKSKPSLTRSDVGALLASIGAPGKARAKKLRAVQELERKNSQGHGLELTLDTYKEY